MKRQDVIDLISHELRDVIMKRDLGSINLDMEAEQLLTKLEKHGTLPPPVDFEGVTKLNLSEPVVQDAAGHVYLTLGDFFQWEDNE